MKQYNLSQFTEEYDMKGDLVPAMTRFTEQHAKGDWELTLSDDLNLMYPEAGQDKTVFIANNDAGNVMPAFNLKEQKNIVIDGCGAKLQVKGLPISGRGNVNLLYSPLLPFVIEECENVVIKNLSIDWATPAIMQGVVVESRPGEIIVEPQTAQRWWTWNGDLYLEGEGWTWSVQRLLAAEPDTGTIIRNSGDNFGNGYETNWYYDTVEDTGLRVRGDFDRMPGVGKLVFFWATGFNTGGRRSPAIFINKSKNITFENVTIHNCWGMGLIAQRSEDITMNQLITEPSGDRKFSLAADATHFVSCRGELNFSQCRFQNMFDDGINVHGTYILIIRKLKQNTVRVKCGHNQHLGIDALSVGDELEMLRKDDLSIIDCAKVISIAKLNQEVYDIVLDKDLDARAGDLFENASWYPDINVNDCIIRWNRARGMLLNGRGKIRVSNSHIESPGAGIMVETSGTWCESGRIADFEIKNNVFENCAHTSMWGNANIVISPEIKDPTARMEACEKGELFTLHENVTIADNRFIHTNAPIIEAKYIDQLTITDNTIEKTPDADFEDDFEIQYCTNITIENNGIK